MLNPLSLITILVVIFLVIEELRLRNSVSPLRLKTKQLVLNESKGHLDIEIIVDIKNTHKRIEVMIPSFKVNVIPLGAKGIKSLNITSHIKPLDPGLKQREDEYWQSYIVKSLSKTQIKITLGIDSIEERIDSLENLWVNFIWSNYGPFGHINLKQGIVVPIKRPNRIKQKDLKFTKFSEYKLLPVRTHILGITDNILDIFREYTGHIIQPGDILTIGETPLSIIQGRYIDPLNLKPTWFTKVLCRAFHPTSSLATACGLQALINIVGPSRVFFSWILGIAAKVIGINGVFYRVAGNQARLIDDITGTTPPYDQTIVLGPLSTERICEEISNEMGVQVAIVDANDLGRVKILATSRGCNKALLKKALQTNPAGNADEKTPIVIVRPS